MESTLPIAKRKSDPRGAGHWPSQGLRSWSAAFGRQRWPHDFDLVLGTYALNLREVDWTGRRETLGVSRSAYFDEITLAPRGLQLDEYPRWAVAPDQERVGNAAGQKDERPCSGIEALVADLVGQLPLNYPIRLILSVMNVERWGRPGG